MEKTKAVAPEVLAEFQKLDARLKSTAANVAQAQRQRELAEDVIDRESVLNAKYVKDMAAFVKRVGGIPTPPKPPQFDAKGKRIEGTGEGDWTLEKVKEG